MRTLSHNPLYIVALLLTILTAAPTAWGQVSVTTYHNDNARTGQNTNETKLTPTNVNSQQFGRLFSQPVDSDVYSQPLYLPNVVIPGKGTHNVLYVTTEHNSVYAFDADNNLGTNANPLWQVNLGESAAEPNPYFGHRYGPGSNIYPEIGITGTPVINPATNTIYVVAFTEDAPGGPYHQMLHALDCTTGADVHTPVEIVGSVPGHGYDALNGTVTFNPMQALQRSALLLNNGVVYVSFASHSDTDPYHGWIFGYDAVTMQQVAMLNVTPNGQEGGIWMTGNGPAADAGGNVWTSIGNGTFDADVTLGGNGDYGDSVLGLPKLLTTLPPLYFTPSDQFTLAQNDEDLGSGGLTLIPDQSVGPTHLLVTTGKEGTIYVLDRDHMGGFHATIDSVVSEYPQAIPGTMSSPAYWNGNLYYLASNNVLMDYSLSGGQLTLIGKSALQFPDPGATPSISASGTQNGIVWALESDGQNQPTNSTVLHAYDAGNVTNELYNTTQAGPRDDPGLAVKFAVPTIANGKVYVPAQYEISAYGLGPSSLVPTPVITPNGGFISNPITITDSVAGTTIYYTTDGSTPTRSSTVYTVPFTLQQCSTVIAVAVKPGMLDSLQASAFFGQQGPTGSGTGLLADYFSNPDLTGNTVVRVDPTINFGWPNNSPATGIGPNNWSARWSGSIQAQFTDTYTLFTLSDDGIRMWVNGQEVINDWTNHGPTYDFASVPMVAGQKYDVTIEYYQAGGGATAQLWWSSGCTTPEIVPQTQLYPATPAPVISPGTGKYTVDIPVTISSAITGAVINYTIDGSVPTQGSTVYSAVFTVHPGTVVKAIATAAGYPASSVATAIYGRTIPFPWKDSDVGSVAAAGSAGYAQGNFVDTGSGDDIWNMADAFHYIYQPLNGDGQITARVTGIDPTDPWAKAGVMIRTALGAGDVNAYSLVSSGNGIEFQDRPAGGGISYGVPGPFSSAPYWVRIARSGNTITGSSSADGLSWQTISTAAVTLPALANIGMAVTAHNNGTLSNGLFDNVTVSFSHTSGAPSISPNGTTAIGSQQVTLSDAVTGATIFYTTDGSTPIAGGVTTLTYSAPFTLAANSTVKAIAVEQGNAPSAVVSATFTIVTQTPVIIPNGGAFTGSQQVSISDVNVTAQLFYTIDGSVPVPGAGTTQAYTAPFTLTSSATVKAVALAPGASVSAVTSATFTNGTPTPTISPNGGTFTKPTQVTLSDSNAKASIYFTTDGTTPSPGLGTTQLYAKPFTLNASATVKAMAVATGIAASSVVSAAFKLQSSVEGEVFRAYDMAPVVGVTVTLTDQTQHVFTATTAADSVGSDGNSVNYSFAVLAPGTYALAVTAPGYALPTPPLPATLVVPSTGVVRQDVALNPIHTYAAGLQLFSAPNDYSSQTLSSALAGLGTSPLAVWDPVGSQYHLSPSAPADRLRPGQGYWVRATAPLQLGGLATMVDATKSFSVFLFPGWNMVGDPFTVPVNIAAMRSGSANNPGSISGFITLPMYSYDPAANAYVAIGASGALAPYGGYWVFANHQGTLLINGPSGP